MGPGGKTSYVAQCGWFEGRFAVICHTHGKMPQGPTQSLGILGYSMEEKVYTYSGVDNSGRAMTTIPRGTLQSGIWTYMDDGTMGGSKVKTRTIIQELSPVAYAFQMDVQLPDGSWATVMKSKSTKTH